MDSTHERAKARRRAFRLAGHPAQDYPGCRTVHAASDGDRYAIILQLPDRTLRFCCGVPDFRYETTLFCQTGHKFRDLFEPVINEYTPVVAWELSDEPWLCDVFPVPGDRLSFHDRDDVGTVTMVTDTDIAVTFDGKREVSVSRLNINRLLPPAA